MKLQTKVRGPNKEFKDFNFRQESRFLRRNFKQRMYRLSKSRRLLGLLQLKIKKYLFFKSK